eukprot:snap_masked-scaffold_26-processed-gene-1.24-mRNA-1 protein AED:1.00 eAED:1.00 QI:0/0/0/0/1/1/2/0/68
MEPAIHLLKRAKKISVLFCFKLIEPLFGFLFSYPGKFIFGDASSGHLPGHNQKINYDGGVHLEFLSKI